MRGLTNRFLPNIIPGCDLSIFTLRYSFNLTYLDAASVASTFLTTEAAVADIPEKEMPQGAGMGMDGMY